MEGNLHFGLALFFFFFFLRSDCFSNFFGAAQNDQHAANRGNNVISSSIYRWRIENVSKWKEENHLSPIFSIGCHKWVCNLNSYLSFYVSAVECKNSRYAKFSLAVLDQTNNRNTLRKDTKGRMIRFKEDERDWGFEEFIQFRQLHDPSNGYIVDDACIIEVQLYTNSTEDSIEEGRKMYCPDHSDKMFPHEKTKKPKKPRKDDSSAVQRSNGDKNEGLSVSSKSITDNQLMLPPISVAEVVSFSHLFFFVIYKSYIYICKLNKSNTEAGYYSVSHATDGTDGDDDDPDFSPFVRPKRKAPPVDQTVADTSAKRSRIDTLNAWYSSENTEDVEIPNVDDALQIITTSGDAGLCEKDTVNPAKGDACIPPADPSANPPVPMNILLLPNGDATRVMDESTAPTTPFVNSSVLDSEAGSREEFEVPSSILGGAVREYSASVTPAVDAGPAASTLLDANLASELQTDVTDAGQTSASVPGAVPSNIIASHPLSSSSGVEQTESHMFGNPFVAPQESEDDDLLMQSAMLDYESTFSSLARFGDYCHMSHKLNMFYHAKSKDLATRLSITQREKDLLVSEVCDLKMRMQGLVTRADEADASLAKQIEATNGVQEQLAVANARIQELESLNQAQALQHADVQLQLHGDVAGLKSQLKDNAKRAKEFYVKWAKDQVNQAFDVAESSGMMKPGEKFKRC
ncbi:hypothetical protein MKW92_013755 [Papaver armeniacum]|nr:hypothetical protein MKW92_013755 [Papaver armeniacum]